MAISLQKLRKRGVIFNPTLDALFDDNQVDFGFNFHLGFLLADYVDLSILKTCVGGVSFILWIQKFRVPLKWHTITSVQFYNHRMGQLASPPRQCTHMKHLENLYLKYSLAQTRLNQGMPTQPHFPIIWLYCGGVGEGDTSSKLKIMRKTHRRLQEIIANR